MIGLTLLDLGFVSENSDQLLYFQIKKFSKIDSKQTFIYSQSFGYYIQGYAFYIVKNDSQMYENIQHMCSTICSIKNEKVNFCFTKNKGIETVCS